MKGWKEYKIVDILEIKYGKDHKKLRAGKFPLLGTGGIMRHVESFLYDDESILIPRKGTLTSLFYMNEPFWTVDTMFWSKVNRELVIPKYFYYYLKTIDLSTYNVGSTIPSLTTNLLNNLKVIINESKETQRKIAGILSAYDDLIENNLKRIKLLEEKAQLTYEEWFVRMKFPGHETTPINEGTGLPEGWVFGTLSELINYQSGYAYKSSKFTSKGYPIIKIKNIVNNTIDVSNTIFIEKEYAEQTDKFKLNAGDLLIAMTGATVGKVGVVPITNIPCYLNQRVGRFLKYGEVDNTSFINCFFTIGSGLDHVMNIARGAAQPNISSSQILSIESVIPPIEILKEFSDIAINNAKEILNFQKQNQLLKEARDLLLPRLMTGMIDVDKLKGVSK